MRLYYRICRFICQMMFLLYCRGRVFGLRNVPQTGGVLLVCNHQSFLDPVLATLAAHREGNYMARATLFEKPLLRRLIESLNAFPVRLGSADIAAVKQILRRLRDGKLVVIFPEATRTRDGRIGQIQSGFASIAKRGRATIVPVLIDGAFEVWPRSRKLPWPGRITVTYGQLLAPDVVQRMDVDRLAQTTRSRLIDMQRDLWAKRRTEQ